MAVTVVRSKTNIMWNKKELKIVWQRDETGAVLIDTIGQLIRRGIRARVTSRFTIYLRPVSACIVLIRLY